MLKTTADQRVSDAAQAAAGAIAQAAAAAQAESRADGSSSQLNPLFINELQHLHKTIFDSVDSIVDTLHDFKSKLNAVNVLITNNLLSKDSSTDDRLLLLQLQQETQNHLDNSHRSRYTHGDPSLNDNSNGTSQNPNDEGIPEIDLNPRAKVVADLWEEWNTGYKNQPSLRSLEARYGTRWRKGRIAKSAQRRKKVIEFIEHEAKKHEGTYSTLEVVDFLDKYRQVQQKGLFWLYGNLPKTLFDDNGNPIFVASSNTNQSNSNSTPPAPPTVSTEGNYEPEHLDPAVTNS